MINLYSGTKPHYIQKSLKNPKDIIEPSSLMRHYVKLYRK